MPEFTALEPRSYIRIRSWVLEPTRTQHKFTVAGYELPTKVGSAVAANYRIFCLGPGDWLFMSPQRTPLNLDQAVNDLSDGLTLIDMSDAFCGLEIRGNDARELVSKGCGVDLHPRQFPVGQCARTRFAQIPVIVHCLDTMPSFELHVASSHFAYLHSWLLDAALEFETTLTAK